MAILIVIGYFFVCSMDRSIADVALLLVLEFLRVRAGEVFEFAPLRLEGAFLWVGWFGGLGLVDSLVDLREGVMKVVTLSSLFLGCVVVC